MKSQPESRRYVIIGSGAAGISAAESIRQVDAAGSITMITEDPFGYYSRPGLAYFLSGEISEHFLYPFTDHDFNQIGIHRIHGLVTEIDRSRHVLKLENHNEIPYDTLLISVGALALRPPIASGDIDGIVTLDSLQDARKIMKLVKSHKTAYVIGGGITALEIVEGLVSQGVRTHYFLRGEHYWNSVLDDTEATIVEHRLRADGVTIHPRTELAEIIEKKGRLTAIRTTDGKVFETGILGIAIGIQPRKSLAEKAGLATDKGILVDQSLRTSDPDIYAAGDVAQVFDPESGKSLLNSLWDPARQQGIIAGKGMAGQLNAYIRDLTFNVTRLAGLTTTLIGMIGSGGDKSRDNDLQTITHGDSEAWRERPEAIIAQANYQVNRLRLLVGKTALMGALVMGDQTLSRPLRQLIANKTDISAIRSQLLEPGAPLSALIAEFLSQQEQVNAVG